MKTLKRFLKNSQRSGLTSSHLKVFLYLFLLLIHFNNCSSSSDMSYNENPESLSSSSLNMKDICTQTELDLFSQGFHPFFTTNCSHCHVSGPGKGTFAHPDASLAFDSFQSMGMSTITSMAVNDSHSYPYTGSHNITEINGLKQQWKLFQTEKAKCASATPTTNVVNDFNPKYKTIKKLMPTITGTPSTITVNGSSINYMKYNSGVINFSLDQDLTPITSQELISTSGAILSVTVSGYSTPSGATGYLIQMPKLKTGLTSLHFKGLHVLINGQPVSYTYTFQHIDQLVYKQMESMLSGGSMLVLGPMYPDDELSLTIGDIEIVDIPAPPPPPILAFDSPSTTILKTQLGFSVTPFKLGVVRTGDSSTPVSVSVTAEGNETLPNIAKKTTDSTGRHRFDWDYKFNTSTDITFLPGETIKYVEIIFSDDLRDEPDKTLTLKLTNPFGATLGSVTSSVISLPDYNDPPTDLVTFSQLMTPGGILEMNCVRCHNSIDRQGGYDMTDYNEMVQKGVIVPGDLTPNNHKMYRRMNPDAPGAGSVTPMPLDGFLTQDLTLIVEAWIKAGAKNN